jgi:hypothetical protein
VYIFLLMLMLTVVHVRVAVLSFCVVTCSCHCSVRGNTANTLLPRVSLILPNTLYQNGITIPRGIL